MPQLILTHPSDLPAAERDRYTAAALTHMAEIEADPAAQASLRILRLTKANTLEDARRLPPGVVRGREVLDRMEADTTLDEVFGANLPRLAREMENAASVALLEAEADDAWAETDISLEEFIRDVEGLEVWR